MGVLCFACLTSRGTNSFYSRFPFQGCLYSKPPWKMELVTPLEQRAGLSAVPCSKDNVSLRVKIWYGPLGKNEGLWSSEFLSCDANMLSSQHLLILPLPVGCGNNRILKPACWALDNKLLRLWPGRLVSSGSIHATLWPAHVLALAGRVNLRPFTILGLTLERSAQSFNCWVPYWSDSLQRHGELNEPDAQFSILWMLPPEVLVSRAAFQCYCYGILTCRTQPREDLK